MKKILHCWIIIYIVFMLSSCKKDETTPAQVASFAIFNAINNSSSIKVDFTGKEGVFASTQSEAAYGRYKRFVVPAGQLVPIKIVPSDNTEIVLFDKPFNFLPGDMYTLFLAGDAENVDTILVKENFSALPDSTMAVQFINCSPSGAIKIVPILVDYYGASTPQTEIAALNYKQTTGFILYPAPASFSSYQFEFRDPITNELLASTFLDWNTHHTTVVIRGYIGGTPELKASGVHYERF